MPQQPPQPSRYRGADSSERGYQRVRVRQDTAENWLKNDPVLASGEFGYVIGAPNPDQMLKCGDGTVPWSRLPYLLQNGTIGPPGQNGHGITVYGPSDRPPSPTNTALFDGDMWLSSTPGYSGSPDFDAAIITPGAQGPKGDAASIVVGVVSAVPPGSPPVVRNVGTAYAAVFDFQIPQGDKGDQGLIGPDGPAGPKGPAGDTFKVSGAVANAAALPAAPPNLAVYITQDDSHLHIYDQASAAAAANGYVDLGAIAGPTGASSFFSNPVADASKLPATGADGQSVIALDTGHMHSWDAAKGVWVDAGKIVGPPGPTTGYDPATVQGAALLWDVRANTYLPTTKAITLVPDGAADLDMLQWDAVNSEWISARPLLSHLGDVDENSQNLTQDCVLVWDSGAQQWTDSRSIQIDDIEFDASGPGTLLEGIAAYSDVGLDPTKDTWVPSCMAVDKYIKEVVNLEDLSDCKQLATATNGQVPTWNDTANTWEPGDFPGSEAFIPFFKGTYSVGHVHDRGQPTENYTPPSNPKEGDIWIDKNLKPPQFKIYKNATWVPWDFTYSIGLLGDLANVELGARQPSHGDALIYNPESEEWTAGSVPAHITTYSDHSHYSTGATVYYKGGLFEATADITNHSPEVKTGMCWLYRREQFDGSGDFLGHQFTHINTVADTTLPPAQSYPSTDTLRRYALQWNSSGNGNFTVWLWSLVIPPGYDPINDPVPVAGWSRIDNQFTSAAKLVRDHKFPIKSMGDCIVFIWDDINGNATPDNFEYHWQFMQFREDLSRLHDVRVDSVQDGQVLAYVAADDKWEPRSLYTKAEVDQIVGSVVTGLVHGEAVMAIASDPPASPALGTLYIVGTTPTGAFVGHANEVALWTGGAWFFTPPNAGESHLVQDVGEIWHWNSTAWVKVAMGTTGVKAVSISKADYTTLSPKDPQTIYLVHN